MEMEFRVIWSSGFPKHLVWVKIQLTQNGESKGDTFVWRFMFHLHNNVFSQFYFMEQHLILFRAMIIQICSLWYQNHTINWEGNKKNSKYFHEDLYTFLCILRLFFIKIFHSVAIKGYLKSLSYNFFPTLAKSNFFLCGWMESCRFILSSVALKLLLWHLNLSL